MNEKKKKKIMSVFKYRRCFDPWNKHEDMTHPSCRQVQKQVGQFWSGVYEAEAVVNKAESVVGKRNMEMVAAVVLVAGGIYLYSKRSGSTP